ncbi:zinc metalloprotease, putative [Pediculus humanus corporis]|uniref:Zinc metalloprotease, putative n=1 Tax=Pediculus humanus subsp. corporis TaxID=121224 RepID=E0W4B9_PEDHC|nr:zinc metalloprotease, putative [Pediculus humanus corporis]EEB20475.1 zinc metalloprotease, putative [Pediculus humanus corporis]
MTKISDLSMRRRKKLGPLEKQLIATSIFLGLLFVTFCILFFTTHYYYNGLLRKNRVCHTSECIESAMTLLQTVDFKQDPCVDFYKYACGNFGTHHPLKENDLYNSWFSEKNTQLNRIILDILKKPVTSYDLKSVKDTKNFYMSCTNKSELNDMGLEPLYEILELLQLSKFVPNNETAENFNLGRTLALAQKYLSQDIFVTLSPGVSNFGFNDLWKRRRRGNVAALENLKKEGKSPNSQTIDIFTKQTKKARIKFMTDIFKKINEDLTNDLESESKNKNVTNFFFNKAVKIMDLASNLHKAVGTTYIYFNKRTDEEEEEEEDEDVDDDDDDDYNVQKNKTERISFAELDVVMRGKNDNVSLSNKIDWEEFLTVLLEKSNKTYDLYDDPLIVENLNYFKSLGKILETTTAETIQSYIWWEIVEQYAKYTTSDVRAIYYKYYQTVYGETSLLSRSQICTNLMKNTMGVALSHEMSVIKNYTLTELKVREMLNDIQGAFEEMVKTTSWLDERTKSVILDKVKGIKKEIGFSNWMTDSIKINKYYEGLDLKESEFLLNIMRVSEWEVQKAIDSLGKFKNNSNDNNFGWFLNPIQVNAYYSHVENAIVIPAGILRSPFYFRGIESLNYGAIGTILGHELTHGFDIEGKNYNKYGELEENLWSENVIDEYEKRAQCFVKQYENFTLYDNQKVNGNFTLAENIADNGGIRESYKAYQIYKGRHGQEPKLPGFENFTHEQLLFLSYANIWCETVTPQYYKSTKDSHSPQRVRVLATLQNMKEFSEAYSCSDDTYMNPLNKCIIW